MMNEEAIGLTFVEIRKRAGVTQQQLADVVGVSKTSVRNWEHGREEPRLFIWQVKALCQSLQCSLDDLPDSFKEKTPKT
jgi:DNA-binding XRE family transcriptional regulator